MLSPEQQRIRELEAQLKEARSQAERIENAKKRLEKSRRAVLRAYLEYRKEYRGILDDHSWTEGTATKRRIYRPETMMRGVERDAKKQEQEQDNREQPPASADPSTPPMPGMSGDDNGGDETRRRDRHRLLQHHRRRVNHRPRRRHGRGIIDKQDGSSLAVRQYDKTVRAHRRSRRPGMQPMQQPVRVVETLIEEHVERAQRATFGPRDQGHLLVVLHAHRTPGAAWLAAAASPTSRSNSSTDRYDNTHRKAGSPPPGNPFGAQSSARMNYTVVRYPDQTN